MKGREGRLLTRVCRQKNDGLHSNNLQFRKLGQVPNAATSTVNCTDPCGKSDLLAHSGDIFVDICDVIWAVSAVEINNLCRS